MIRIGLPAPMMLRLRLRSQITANRMARQTRYVRQGILTTAANHLVGLRRLPDLWVRKPRTESAADRKELLMEFETRYQSLVDLLCWAAKDGVHAHRDERYAELRGWFLVHYETIRPALAHHLETEEEDILPVEEGTPIPRDAFESLFLPANVDAIIHSETVISRIMRTRCALDSYREQLETA